MLRIFIILIGVLTGFAGTLHAGECIDGNEMIVTAPRNGVKIMQPSVMIRGYLCHNFPLITIRNETTSSETFAETSEVCDGSRHCTYQFAAPVRGLALGENHITAEIPGDEETLVEIDVIRTALAGL